MTSNVLVKARLRNGERCEQHALPPRYRHLHLRPEATGARHPTAAFDGTRRRRRQCHQAELRTRAAKKELPIETKQTVRPSDAADVQFLRCVSRRKGVDQQRSSTARRARRFDTRPALPAKRRRAAAFVGRSIPLVSVSFGPELPSALPILSSSRRQSRAARCFFRTTNENSVEPQA